MEIIKLLNANIKIESQESEFRFINNNQTHLDHHLYRLVTGMYSDSWINNELKESIIKNLTIIDKDMF